MASFTQQMGLPWVVAFLVVISESFGSVCLIAGLLMRFTAASYIIIMLGTIATVHWQNGLFVNWFGRQQGEGFEFHLLVMALSTALVVIGGGKWSVDGMIARLFERREINPPRRMSKAA